uniref:acid phosphatase n=1 Tax=Saccoglossus kowalevskii TaxID=10224 RepID=A0ABM0MM64_SACKO|nr:PREDICTED: lysosomal acid phosphatase-like [Saccoglossus kowalevskii]
MAGLYPPKGKEVWFPEDVLTWQPIPIHTTMVTMDCLIGFPPCPKYLALLDEAKKSEVDFLDFMREKSGLEHSTSMFDLVAVADSSYFEKVGNKPLPEWFNSSIFDKLMDLNNFATKVKEGSDNMEMKRFCKGVLLNEIADNMIAKARSPQNRTYKMYSYAGQDSMISCILNALGVFNNIVPPPASCVMIELHKHVHAKRTYTVDIYYRNDSSVDPIVLTIPECQTHCPLETFLELTSDVRVTEERWFKDCGGERNFQSYSRGANLHLNKGDHLEY